MGEYGKVQQQFIEVNVGDVNQSNSYACETIKGTRKTHCILGFSKKDPTQVIFRRLSRFCSFWMDNEWDNCYALKHASSWTLKKLEPTKAPINDTLLDNVVLYSYKIETLEDMLEMGDNFVVIVAPTNTNYEEYYTAICKQSKVLLFEQITDGWGNVFNLGNELIQGVYSENPAFRQISYVLLQDAPIAILPANAVVAIKFDMTQTKHKVKGKKISYCVPPKVHERIMDDLGF